MSQFEVECPHCERVFDATLVERTEWEGEVAFWCPMDTCPGTPIPMNENMVGDATVRLERK